MRMKGETVSGHPLGERVDRMCGTSFDGYRLSVDADPTECRSDRLGL